jgi:hypothetical protein
MSSLSFKGLECPASGGKPFFWGDDKLITNDIWEQGNLQRTFGENMFARAECLAALSTRMQQRQTWYLP